MAITEKFTCDICDKEMVPTSAWTYCYEFEIRPRKRSWYYRRVKDSERKLDVCAQCIKKVVNMIKGKNETV